MMPCSAAQETDALDVRYTAPVSDLYSGHGWRVFVDEASLPDGRRKKVARIERADSVNILAFPSPGKLIVLREYRPYYGAYIWMLPSGRVDKEKDIVAGAQRELQEETGYRAGSLKHLWTVHHSESMNFANHIFLAKDLTEDPLPQDADEMIEVHLLTPEEALKNIEESAKVHAVSAYAVRRWMGEGKMA
jgi:ADP-ribose pyrophosphatase